MIINSIIAEYNPFHNGHLFQLNNAKEQTGADYTIVVMSGNFVQRGAPAIIDKYQRARMALSCGADLVIELPSCYSSSSAEYFAMGAVSLIDKLGVADYLCFGSECGCVESLKKIASILTDEPTEFQIILKDKLKDGLSYPSARTEALFSYDSSFADYKDILMQPNNTLGIEYIKALNKRKSSITPVTTLRTKDSHYHGQASAEGIRNQILKSEPDYKKAEELMPPQSYRIFTDTLAEHGAINSGRLSHALKYKLISIMNNDLSEYVDINEDLSNRIKNSIGKFTDYDSFCELIKQKNLTYTRVSRCLLHILLDLKKDRMDKYTAMDYIPYARVLGFRSSSRELLSEIKKKSQIPLITKLADAEKIFRDKNIYDNAMYMLSDELKNNMLYPSNTPCNEFSTPICII